MLLIRRDQVRLLGDSASGRWYVSEIRRRFPVHYRALGEDVSGFVHRSVERAARFHSDDIRADEMRETLRFVCLEVVFGPGFADTADWARDALVKAESHGGVSAIQCLYEAAVFRLAAMAAEAEAIHQASEPDEHEPEMHVPAGDPIEHVEPPEQELIPFPGAQEPSAEPA